MHKGRSFKPQRDCIPKLAASEARDPATSPWLKPHPKAVDTYMHIYTLTYVCVCSRKRERKRERERHVRM